MSSEKETLMDEIEKSLWNLTEDNLRSLCERYGNDGSEIKGMNHRLLRRKVMEEMWDNTDSMKSVEQGMSWLVRLKEDIRRIQKDFNSVNSPSQSDNAEDCDEEWNKEGGDGLLSNTPDQSKLKSHIRSHTAKQHTVNPSVKPHHCSDCGKQFIVKSSLKHHRLVFHTEHPHRCGQCKKSFITAERLESHIKTRHPPNDPLKNPHVCSECGKGFHQAGCLKRHLRTHTGEKPFVCPRCGRAWSDSGNLKRHMRKTHPGEEMVVKRLDTQRSDPTGNREEMNVDSIKWEEQGTSWSLQLKEDIRRIRVDASGAPMSPNQADDDAEDCDEGGTRLPSNRLEAKFDLERQTPEQRESGVTTSQSESVFLKPHLCTTCGKGFKKAGCLKRHLRTHTGEKPFVCPRCGKAWSDSGNFKRHMRKTHPGEEMVVKSIDTETSDPTGSVEEMNVDSIKWEEQGTSWSLQLKEEDACGATGIPSQAHADGVDCNVEDRDWLPSIGLKAEPMSPSQSVDDASDRKEEWNEAGGTRLPSNGLEAALRCGKAWSYSRDT